jgi:hypothetical protein
MVGVFVADFGGNGARRRDRRRAERVPPGRDGEGARAKFAPESVANIKVKPTASTTTCTPRPSTARTSSP